VGRIWRLFVVLAALFLYASSAAAFVGLDILRVIVLGSFCDNCTAAEAPALSPATLAIVLGFGVLLVAGATWVARNRP